MEKSNELEIAIFQMKLINGDIPTNMRHFEEMYVDLEDHRADLVVLPEMWNTGFVVDGEEDLDSAYDEGIAVMRRLSERRGCAVYGSLLKAEEDGRHYNVGVFMDVRKGLEEEYRKRHLFEPGGEAEHFTAGEERKVIEWRGWRWMLSVCYDLRFPVWLRYTEDQPYDVMLNVANWPKPRDENWKIMLMSRAIENQCYVIGCNRVGTGAGKLHYPGYSGLIDPDGKMVVPFSYEKEEILYGTISMDHLKKVRKNKPYLKDGDTFELK